MVEVDLGVEVEVDSQIFFGEYDDAVAS